MTVYVVQNQMKRDMNTGQMTPMFDLTPAREYGKIEFLLNSGPVPLLADGNVKQLNARLQSFDDGTDYLLAVGNPVAIAAAVAIVAVNCGGRVPLLVWDRFVRQYNAVVIDVNGG